MCSPLVSLTITITCFNEEGEVDCTKHMLRGTRAKGECKPFYKHIVSPLYTEVVCDSSGQWSYPLFECQPGKNLAFCYFSNVSLIETNEIACIINSKFM